MGETLSTPLEKDELSQRILAVQASTDFVKELIDDKHFELVRNDIDGIRRDVFTAPGGETLTRTIAPGSQVTFELATENEKFKRRWEIGGASITVSRQMESGEPEVSTDTSEEGLKALRNDLFNVFYYPGLNEDSGTKNKKPKKAVRIKAVFTNILDDM